MKKRHHLTKRFTSTSNNPELLWRFRIFVLSLPLIQLACASGRWVRTLWNSLAATATRGFRSHQKTSHRAKGRFQNVIFCTKTSQTLAYL